MNYIINLDKRTDRWEKMKKQVDNLHIPIERFPAICPQWNTNISDYIKKMEFPFLKKTLEGHVSYSLGCSGVFQSQLELWKRCIEYNKPILIFEDDVTFQTNDFFSDLNDILNEINHDFDMIVFFPNIPLERLNQNIIEKKYTYYLKQPIFGAYAYYLHPNFAKKTLPFLETMTSPFDIQVKKHYYDKPHKCYLSKKHLVTTPCDMSRDSNIIQRERLHQDSIHDITFLKNPFPLKKNGPFIFSKYKIKLNLNTLFLQNPCRSIKMFYNNVLVFHSQHYKTKSTIDTEIYLEKNLICYFIKLSKEKDFLVILVPIEKFVDYW